MNEFEGMGAGIAYWGFNILWLCFLAWFIFRILKACSGIEEIRKNVDQIANQKRELEEGKQKHHE